MKVTLINPAQLNSKYKFMGVVAPPLGSLIWLLF